MIVHLPMWLPFPVFFSLVDPDFHLESFSYPSFNLSPPFGNLHLLAMNSSAFLSEESLFWLDFNNVSTAY